MARRIRYCLWQVFRAGTGPILWLRVGRGVERRGLGVELIFDAASPVGKILLRREEEQDNRTVKEGGKK